MPSNDGKFDFTSVLFGAWAGFWGGVLLGFTGCFIQVGSQGASLGTGWSTFLACLIPGVVVGAVAAGIKEAGDVRKQHDAQEVARTEARRRAADAKEASRRSLQARITQNAHDAVATFASLPKLLRAAEEQRDSAKGHYRNGAFSPFWECVEAAYGILGRYKAALDDIARLSGQYAANVSTYVGEHGTPTPPFTRFPVRVNDARASGAAQDLEALLAKIVYEAQKEPTFAMIWEQRRNTSVLIAGFTTLTAAVAGMRKALSAAVNSLASTIESSSTNVSHSVASLTASHSQLGNELLVQVRRATTRLNEISELEKRAQGYPLF